MCGHRPPVHPACTHGFNCIRNTWLNFENSVSLVLLFILKKINTNELWSKIPPLPRETTRSKEHGKFTHLASIQSEHWEKI